MVLCCNLLQSKSQLVHQSKAKQRTPAVLLTARLFFYFYDFMCQRIEGKCQGTPPSFQHGHTVADCDFDGFRFQGFVLFFLAYSSSKNLV